MTPCGDGTVAARPDGRPRSSTSMPAQPATSATAHRIAASASSIAERPRTTQGRIAAASAHRAMPSSSATLSRRGSRAGAERRVTVQRQSSETQPPVAEGTQHGARAPAGELAGERGEGPREADEAEHGRKCCREPIGTRSAHQQHQRQRTRRGRAARARGGRRRSARRTQPTSRRSTPSALP